jgi:hypothetical protein
MRTPQYSRNASPSSTLLLLLLVWLFAGCGERSEDPRTVHGALAKAARALEAEDSATLFRLIDQRARHALSGIVDARGQARALIEADYPASERAQALTALGDGAEVATAAELFQKRCAASCMQALAREVGVPVSEERKGQDVVVKTARGTILHMHAGKDTWYGLHFHTEALMAEAKQAAQELTQIRDNAAVYRKRRELEAGEHVR